MPAALPLAYTGAFPMFSVASTKPKKNSKGKSEDHTTEKIFVSGGGGSSKTGIPNGIEIVDREKFTAGPLALHKTGENCAWQMAMHPTKNLMVVGLGRNLEVRMISSDCETIQEGFAAPTVDSSDDSLIQKAVRFCRKGDLLLSGGEDKTLRVYKMKIAPGSPKKGTNESALERQCELGAEVNGHHKMIYDADFHPDGKEAASASEDGTVRIWNIAQGVKIPLKQVLKAPIATEMLHFRGCRYTPEGSLITVQTKSRGWTYITFWVRSPEKGYIEKRTDVASKKTMTAFTMDRTGEFIGVATNDGNIAVYSTKGGAVTKYCEYKEVHDLPVSALTFNFDNSEIYSVSPDRTLKVNTVKQQSQIDWFSILYFIFLCAVAFGCYYLMYVFQPVWLLE